MARSAELLLAGLLLAAVPVQAAESPSPAGKWKVMLPRGRSGQQALWLVQLQEKDGKWTGKVLDAARGAPPLRFGPVSMSKDVLRFQLQGGEVSFQLELRLPVDKGGLLRGVVRVERTVEPVELEHTQMASLKQADVLRDLLARQTQGVAVVDAALQLLSQASAEGAMAAEVRSWAAKASRAAQDYGPEWHREILLEICETLDKQKGHEAAALPYARLAERMLTPRDRLSVRKRTLDSLVSALKAAGKADEAKEVEAKIAKLDLAIKPATFSGRKGKSDRVVLVELFTGSHDAGCVAGELAFDALASTFKPSEVVLLQYHLNYRNPDPLGNVGCEGRLKYYADVLNALPTALIDGGTEIAGGGGREAGQERYDLYRQGIVRLLEQPAQAKIEAEAKRDGNKITVPVRVSGITPGAGFVRLRVALVEEQVHYSGKNKLAQHTNVVRTFLGGADGIALKEKTFRKELSVDLGELRKELNGFLDRVAREAAFPDKERPLELSKLRIVAFVQNDETHEVLQAASVEVPGK